jgi:NADP-dependent 3-hydroxy acid dehydrogenase YdfG
MADTSHSAAKTWKDSVVGRMPRILWRTTEYRKHGLSPGRVADLALGTQKRPCERGDRIVAAGRKRSAIAERLGPDSGSLLSVQLDVTDVVQVRTAGREAVPRFSGIDVLANNAVYEAAGPSERTLRE